MDPSGARKNSNAEIAFHLLRTLVKGRALWGSGGALPVSSICAELRVDATQVDGVLDGLTDEGMVLVDREGTVHLTEQALRDLC
jgi:hypothetical protein